MRVAQERGVARDLLGKGDKLLGEELSIAFCFVGQVKDVADVFERCGHGLNVLGPEYIVL